MELGAPEYCPLAAFNIKTTQTDTDTSLCDIFLTFTRKHLQFFFFGESNALLTM